MSDANKLQLRLDLPLAQKLRAAATQVGWTPSAYARYLLQTALGDDNRLAALDQTIWILQGRLQRKMPEVGDVMREAIEQILLEPDDAG